MGDSPGFPANKPSESGHPPATSPLLPHGTRMEDNPTGVPLHSTAASTVGTTPQTNDVDEVNTSTSTSPSPIPQSNGSPLLHTSTNHTDETSMKPTMRSFGDANASSTIFASPIRKINTNDLGDGNHHEGISTPTVIAPALNLLGTVYPSAMNPTSAITALPSSAQVLSFSDNTLNMDKNSTDVDRNGASTRSPLVEDMNEIATSHTSEDVLKAAQLVLAKLQSYDNYDGGIIYSSQSPADRLLELEERYTLARNALKDIVLAQKHVLTELQSVQRSCHESKLREATLHDKYQELATKVRLRAVTRRSDDCVVLCNVLLSCYFIENKKMGCFSVLFCLFIFSSSVPSTSYPLLFSVLSYHLFFI